MNKQKKITQYSAGSSFGYYKHQHIYDCFC